MIGVRHIFQKTLLHFLIEEFRLRYRFKYVLPQLRQITLDGLDFDVSTLSPKIRNRLLSGAYEQHEKKMCRDFLDPNDIVVEIGAAIGFIALICQKHLGITDYACFEANPRTYQVLRRNCDLNSVAPRLWNMALAHENGHVDLEVGSDFWENSICFDGRAGDGIKTMRVPAGTLQTLLRLVGKNPNALIIDIEGAEQFIDSQHVPPEVRKIIIELHPKVIGPEVAYNIVAQFIALGFRVARQEDDTFVFLRK